MLLKQNINFFVLVCTIFLCNHDALNAVEIQRVLYPTQQDVALQSTLKNKRFIHRQMVTLSTAAMLCAAFYGASLIRHNFEHHKNNNLIPLPANMVLANQATPSTPNNGWLWPLKSIANGIKKAGVSIKDFSWDTSKFFADSTSMLLAGVITTAVYEQLRSKWDTVYATESVSWFLHQQTKIAILLNDLKAQTAQYDLHSSLLSQEIFNQDAQTHIKAFVKDVTNASAYNVQDSVLTNNQYFEHLLSEIQNKYIRKAQHLEQMQEQIIPHLAQRRRALQDIEPVDVFGRDVQSRNDITELCNLLAKEMNAMLAFILMNNTKHANRVSDFMNACNSYIDRIEQLLMLSNQDLEQASKNNIGMFTITYEYEQLLQQQVDFFDKYCKLQ